MAHGRVVNPSGMPLAGIAVSAYDETMRVTTRTDANGCFHIGRVCSPFKHKVPLRVGELSSVPVDTVDGPTTSDLHLLITVSDDQDPAATKVQTGADIEACTTRENRATLSNKP